MLTHLYIKNYALIEELDIDLYKGFSVITGETGAGKSIILGAIGLLLGQRADSKSIFTGADKCVIEANFDIQTCELESFFNDNDLDYNAEECIIRREITTSGKSRTYINDTPCNVAVLKELGEHLIDIHSQHKNLLIGQKDYQLSILDIMAGDQQLLKEYQQEYATLKQLRHQLEQAQDEYEKNHSEEEYLQFQLEQLEELNPKAGEDEELETEQNELSHAEDIKATLYQVDNLFSNDTDMGGANEMLRRIGQQLGKLTSIYPVVNDYTERIESALIELKDISSDLSDLAERVEYNPKRLEQITERLNTIYSLEQKHHLSSTEELEQLTNELRHKLDSITYGLDHINELQKQIDKQETSAHKLADRLTKERQKAAKLVEKSISASLISLDMPNNQFRVQITPLSDLSNSGMDNVTFLFNANRSTTLYPLSEIASGGEVARVMLALKAINSENINMPTIIFDEIDTGVSGRVADSMASLMEQMANKHEHQIIAITHLPQIASRGANHYWVYKEDSKQQTLSHIRLLNDNEREQEIAHMLSGSEITAAAIENAKQLLKR